MGVYQTQDDAPNVGGSGPSYVTDKKKNEKEDSESEKLRKYYSFAVRHLCFGTSENIIFCALV